ncbi:MAG: transposase [Selenomonadaceae bacterium]|nr:transposase [Selenomonadaceae bacterium]
MQNKYTNDYYKAKQGRLPMFISDSLEITDSVLAFDEIMEEIEIGKYLKPEQTSNTGRPGYNRVNMLKTILFGFMDTGYVSLRELEDRCKVNIRYMYLMDNQTPSYRAFGYFINDELLDSVERIFQAVMQYIQNVDAVDLQHLYIDGSKFEANANKYSWVWKRGTEKSRYRLYEKITALLKDMNNDLQSTGIRIETSTEYAPEYLHEAVKQYASLLQLDETQFVHGRGHHKSTGQRHYEKLMEYASKLAEYVEKINICGSERNSYAKTDHDATFMRMKKDYMGNDQLLPAYNVQIGVADEYIAVVDVMQYRSDMDCFVPLMEKFQQLYGFYPKYPVADAGYGSFNNYLYCQEHGMEKYMKFPMYKKETHDEKYRDNPFRAVNFKTDEDGDLVCPNNRKFHLAYRRAVKGNKYGRQEEIYKCEGCGGCPYADQCKKTPNDKTITLNRELSAMHQEVLDNLESIHGAFLRMNRSIQAEGTFGILKYDRWYKRVVRKGMNSVKLEIFLVSIGHNLYKLHNKRQRIQVAA